MHKKLYDLGSVPYKLKDVVIVDGGLGAEPSAAGRFWWFGSEK